MNTRRASTADAEAIGRFQTLAWEETYRGVVPDEYLDRTGWRVRADRWRSRLETGERTVWLAYVDELLVGVASTAVTAATRPDPPALELATLYVRRDWHGRAIAPPLLERAIGRRPAHLWVFAGNARAQRFYAKHGFSPTAEEQPDPDTGLTEVRWLRR